MQFCDERLSDVTIAKSGDEAAMKPSWRVLDYAAEQWKRVPRDRIAGPVHLITP
jgi:hypothetical protein